MMGGLIDRYCRKDRNAAKQKTQIVTSQQRLIVMRNWQKLSAEMAPMGIAVLLRIFELRPKYKNSFSFCQKTGNDLIQDKQFRTHAFRFAQAASAVVENIDNLDDEVKGFFFMLGRKHVGLPDFRVSYFGILSDAMVYVWEDQLRERFSAQAERAWRCVFTFIAGTMADGYIQEQMDRESQIVRELSTDPQSRERTVSIRTELPPSMRSKRLLSESQPKQQEQQLISKESSLGSMLSNVSRRFSFSSSSNTRAPTPTPLGSQSPKLSCPIP